MVKQVFGLCVAHKLNVVTAHILGARHQDGTFKLTRGAIVMCVALADEQARKLRAPHFDTKLLIMDEGQCDRKRVLDVLIDERIEQDKRAKASAEVHMNVSCNLCGAKNIRGIRYNCNICEDFDVCHVCWNRLTLHDDWHEFTAIRKPRA